MPTTAKSVRLSILVLIPMAIVAMALPLWAQTPVPISVSPTGGSGPYQTFVASYTDALGAGDIQQAVLLIQGPTNPGTGAGQCIVRMDPQSNLLYLLVDQAGSWLGPIPAGTHATLSNSQCILNAANSFWSTLSSTEGAATFDVTFKGAFTNAQGLWLYAVGSQGAGGYGQYGSWTVFENSTTPSASFVSPSSGTGSAQAFNATFSDPNGGMDIQQAVLLVQGPTNPGNGAHQCIVRFDPAPNQLYLLVDQAGSWLGPIAANSSQSLANTQCTLSGASSGNASGTNLSVNFVLTFNTVFAGLQGLWLYAVNPFGSGGYGQYGSWTVPGSSGGSFTNAVAESIFYSIPDISNGSTCTDITGTWDVSISGQPLATWTLSQSNQENSGILQSQPTGTVQASLPGCGTVTWRNVTGSMSNGTFSLTASNPDQISCGGGNPAPLSSFVDTVTLSAPACTSGTGTHTPQDGSRRVFQTSWLDPSPAPAPVPSKLKLEMGNKKQWSGQVITGCDSRPAPGNATGYGYSYCATYTLLDQSNPGKPILNTTNYSAHEDTTVVKSTYNAQQIGGVDQRVSRDGKWVDFVALIRGSGPIAADAKSVTRQVITIKDSNNGMSYMVRINCIVKTAADVAINDVTTSSDNSCTSF